MLRHYHHVPGRLRISLGRLKHNRPAAGPLRDTLLAAPGVKAVVVTLAIGSVTVHYEQDRFDLAAFWTLLHDHGLLDKAPERQIAPGAGILASAAANVVASAVVDALLQRMLGPAGGALLRLVL